LIPDGASWEVLQVKRPAAPSILRRSGTGLRGHPARWTALRPWRSIRWQGSAGAPFRPLAPRLQLGGWRRRWVRWPFRNRSGCSERNARLPALAAGHPSGGLAL